MDQELRLSLEQLAQNFDDRHLSLTHAGSSESQNEARSHFSNSRALSALLLVLAGDEARLEDAVYEALMTGRPEADDRFIAGSSAVSAPEVTSSQPLRGHVQRHIMLSG